MQKEFIVPNIPNTSIRMRVREQRKEQTLVLPIVFHDAYELFSVREGHVDYTIGKECITLRTGDLLFLNSRVPHQTTIHKGTLHFYLLFSEEAEHEKPSSAYFTRSTIPYFHIRAGTPLNTALTACLAAIRQEYREQAESFDAFIKAEVCRILALLYREGLLVNPKYIREARARASRILPALDYIDAHYNEEITLSSLSRLLNLNESYFCRLFKQATQTSFVQYLNYVRICKAEHLLLTTDMNISEICYAVGFSNASYFNRIFKKFKSCSPGLYKRTRDPAFREE